MVNVSSPVGPIKIDPNKGTDPSKGTGASAPEIEKGKGGEKGVNVLTKEEAQSRVDKAEAHLRDRIAALQESGGDDAVRAAARKELSGAGVQNSTGTRRGNDPSFASRPASELQRVFRPATTGNNTANARLGIVTSRPEIEPSNRNNNKTNSSYSYDNRSNGNVNKATTPVVSHDKRESQQNVGNFSSKDSSSVKYNPQNAEKGSVRSDERSVAFVAKEGLNQGVEKRDQGGNSKLKDVTFQQSGTSQPDSTRLTAKDSGQQRTQQQYNLNELPSQSGTNRNVVVSPLTVSKEGNIPIKELFIADKGRTTDQKHDESLNKTEVKQQEGNSRVFEGVIARKAEERKELDKLNSIEDLEKKEKGQHGDGQQRRRQDQQDQSDQGDEDSKNSAISGISSNQSGEVADQILDNGQIDVGLDGQSNVTINSLLSDVLADPSLLSSGDFLQKATEGIDWSTFPLYNGSLFSSSFEDLNGVFKMIEKALPSSYKQSEGEPWSVVRSIVNGSQDIKSDTIQVPEFLKVFTGAVSNPQLFVSKLPSNLDYLVEQLNIAASAKINPNVGSTEVGTRVSALSESPRTNSTVMTEEEALQRVVNLANDIATKAKKKVQDIFDSTKGKRDETIGLLGGIGGAVCLALLCIPGIGWILSLILAIIIAAIIVCLLCMTADNMSQCMIAMQAIMMAVAILGAATGIGAALAAPLVAMILGIIAAVIALAAGLGTSGAEMHKHVSLITRDKEGFFKAWVGSSAFAKMKGNLEQLNVI